MQRPLESFCASEVELLDFHTVLHAYFSQSLLEQAALLQVSHRGKHSPAT